MSQRSACGPPHFHATVIANHPRGRGSLIGTGRERIMTSWIKVKIAVGCRAGDSQGTVIRAARVNTAPTDLPHHITKIAEKFLPFTPLTLLTHILQQETGLPECYVILRWVCMCGTNTRSGLYHGYET